MKNIALILIAFLFSGITKGQNTTIAINDEKKQAIENYLNYLEEQNQIIGAVSIAQNGKEIYTRSFGQKNLTQEILNPEKLRYQMGSITKMFTAILIAKLVEKKRISYEDKLVKYFPEMPNSKKIKISHMLNHTSGLKGFIVKDDNMPEWLFEPVKSSEIINEIVRQGIAFEPGKGLKYSNGAYYLLTKIVEKKYKKTYKEIVEEKILKPLGLTKINSIAASDRYSDIARPYEKLEKWTEVQDFYFPNVAGVGDMIASPQDLNRFIHSLFEHKVVKKETLLEMLPKGEKTFGYGIMAVPFYNQKLYGHGGDTRGTHCVMGYDADQKLAITYMINGEHFLTNDFAIGLLSILYDKDYEYPKFDIYKVDPTSLDAYVGTYSSATFPLKVTIFKEGNKLKAQATNQPSFVLTPTDKDLFAYQKAKLEIKFVVKEQKLILTQMGMSNELMKE